MRPAGLPRTSELVLVTADGKPVGVLPPVLVATPWWQEVEPEQSLPRWNRLS